MNNYFRSSSRVTFLRNNAVGYQITKKIPETAGLRDLSTAQQLSCELCSSGSWHCAARSVFSCFSRNVVSLSPFVYSNLFSNPQRSHCVFESLEITDRATWCRVLWYRIKSNKPGTWQWEKVCLCSVTFLYLKNTSMEGKGR